MHWPTETDLGTDLQKTWD